MLEGGEEVSTGVGRRLSLGLRLGELVNRVPDVGDPLLLLMLLFVGAIGLRLGEFVLKGGEEVSTDVGRRLSLRLRLGELVNRESVVGDPMLLLLVLFCTMLGVSVGPSSILPF